MDANKFTLMNIFKKTNFFRYFSMLVIFVFTITFSSCDLFSYPPAPEITDVQIGVNISEDTGRLTSETKIIPPTASKIYLEGFLDTPEDSKHLLEFRWFHEDTLLLSYTNFFTPGYLIATLKRDPNTFEEFPVGNYHVEIWFGTELITSTTFLVR